MRATASITNVQPIDPETKVIRVAFTCDPAAAEALILGVPIGTRVDPRVVKMGERDQLAEAHFRVVQLGPSEDGPWGEPTIVHQERGPARVLLVEKLPEARPAPPRGPWEAGREEPTSPRVRYRRVSVARFRGVVPG